MRFRRWKRGLGVGEVHWVPVRPRPRQMTLRGTVLLLVLMLGEFILCLFEKSKSNDKKNRTQWN
jgi:hypothetical protein